MLFAITIAALVLLQMVSNYTFIHILLGTGIVWALARLVYGPRASEEVPKSPCVPLADLDR